MFNTKFWCLIQIILIITVNTLPQYAQDDTRVTADELKKAGINYFNYSDPGKVNIEVIVLGGVRYPGRYLVPEGTTVIELLSLTGNITKEETADNIRLLRASLQNGSLSDSSIITLNYRELFKDTELKTINKPNPLLAPGDVIVVPITPEKTFWDFFSDVSLVLTPLVTLATLVISIITLNK